MTRPVAGLYPSLHLNLGECYRKLVDLDRARDQLERGQVAVGSGDDGFGQMIKGGLDRLGERLASAWELDHPVQTQTFRQARESNPSGYETAKGGGQQRPYALIRQGWVFAERGPAGVGLGLAMGERKAPGCVRLALADVGYLWGIRTEVVAG